MQLTGIVSAIITPFGDGGETVNHSELKALVESGVRSGLGGIVPCGGTGEFATLSYEERQKVVETCVAAATGRVAVMAQVGGCSTREAVGHARHAKAVGADAMMLATPYYEGIGFDAVRRYFSDVAAASDLPICVYNFPPAMGIHYDVDRMLTLVQEIPSIAYMKDSSGDFALFDALSAANLGIGLFPGEDALAFPGFLKGAAGAINGAANFVGPAMAKMFTAANKGDANEVMAIWRGINPLVSAVIHSGHYNGGVKAACAALGFATGPIRKPYDILPQSAIDAVTAAVRATDPALMNVARSAV